MWFEYPSLILENDILDKRLEIGVATVERAFMSREMGCDKCHFVLPSIVYH